MKGERKIIADTVITHVAPSTGAALDDTLYFGNTIEILMSVPYTEVRNNMISPWLKVVYQKGKFKKIGFVSAIDVALNNKLVYKNYEFFWGVIANNKKDSFINNELVNKNNYQCKLVAMQNGKRFAVSEFEVDENISTDSISMELVKKVKLKNVVCGVVLHFINKDQRFTKIGTSNFVLCGENKIVQLPKTFSLINCVDKECNGVSHIKYISPKSFIVEMQDYSIVGEIAPSLIAIFYKWQNCSYTLIK